MKRSLIALIPVLLLASCEPKFVILALPERTALENQVLGTYEYLTDNDRFYGAVPGVATRGDIDSISSPSGTALELSAVRRNVLKAVLHQEFQRNEIIRLKAAGYIGEASNGYLHLFRDRIPDAELVRVERIASDENTDRRAVVDGIIATNPGLSEQDRVKVEAIFARQYRDSARPGDWYQVANGKWQQAK